MPDHRSLVRFATAHAKGRRDLGTTVPLTSFVGREQELDDLCVCVGQARLVTAVGPGGVGKTRVAAAAVARLELLTRFVDLAQVSDVKDLADAVAAACQVAPLSRQGPIDALIAVLQGQRSRLVMDNCEHVVNAAAVIVERLVLACPGLTVLATSRIRLALPFERVFRVEGLTLGLDGDAVAWFVQRARAAGSEVPGPAELARISVICEALDGMALAVELAATRLPTLGLDGVERGLLDQPGLLTGGLRSAPRQRSMTEALNWSATLLRRPAFVLLCRLSVLVSPFDRDVAVRLTAFPPLSAGNIDASLQELTEQQLVTSRAAADGSRQFRLLEPVRQYALRRMTAADTPAFARHLR